MPHPILDAALAMVRPPRRPDPGTLHVNLPHRPGLPPCQCLEHLHLRAKMEHRMEEAAHDVKFYGAE